MEGKKPTPAKLHCAGVRALPDGGQLRDQIQFKYLTQKFASQGLGVPLCTLQVSIDFWLTALIRMVTIYELYGDNCLP